MASNVRTEVHQKLELDENVTWIQWWNFEITEAKM